MLPSQPAQGFTADGLSELLGRKTEDVERVLRELTDNDVLALEESLYRLGVIAQLRESIDKFVSAIHDRETRLNVLTAVLRNE